MKLKCDNCQIVFDEDELKPSHSVNSVTPDPPEACCPGCGEVWEGEEVEEESGD